MNGWTPDRRKRQGAANSTVEALGAFHGAKDTTKHEVSRSMKTSFGKTARYFSGRRTEFNPLTRFNGVSVVTNYWRAATGNIHIAERTLFTVDAPMST